MSYSEMKDGQVILTMSREDYDRLIFKLGIAAGYAIKNGADVNNALAFMNRLNEGNPNYTPYQVDK